MIPWEQIDWTANALRWIRSSLAAQGRTLTGAITHPHLRPWSTVMQVPTDIGPVYFKAVIPALEHEPALTEALARWQPDIAPEVLALDTNRGWLLLANGGQSLRSLVKPKRDWQRWEPVLRRYAAMQIDLAPRAPDMLALGVLDRRLSTLTDQFAALLADTPALLINQPDGLTITQHDALRAELPAFRNLCTDLAAFGLPETLHHDDFHGANIFVRGERLTFADWGEAAVAHPFFTLKVALRSVAYHLELDADGPEIAHLRDAYLDAWSDYGDSATLHAAFELSQRLAAVARALTWYAAVRDLPVAQKAEYADSVPGWLLVYLGG